MKPGWALLRVRLAGICNTDIEILRGYHNFHGTLGHEFVGEVVRVASAEDRGWIARRVVGEINLACQGLGFRKPCSYCRRGIPTHCARRRVLGIIGQDGAFAEYLALPVVNLHRVPAGVPDEAAVFTEPLAAACEILEQVNVRAHREAAVIGDGKLAQLSEKLLRTVQSAEDKLRRVSESDSSTPVLKGGWSRKQVLGHLIDSASNNHQRFVRAALQGTLEFPRYDQDGFVRVQAIEKAHWALLVSLWADYNLYLAHVIAHLPADKLGTQCRIGDDETVTLKFLAEDYLTHLLHHLNQIGATA